MTTVALKDACPPGGFSANYCEGDIEKVREIQAWMAEDPDTRTQAFLAKRSALKESTLNRVLNGNYPSPVSKILWRCMHTIERERSRNQLGKSRIPYVETTVTRLVRSVCHRTQTYAPYGEMGVVYGVPGTGKTLGIDRYREENPGTYKIDAIYNMSAGMVLTDLVEQTGAVVHTSGRYSGGTHEQKLRAIIRQLDGADTLIIVDEADSITPAALEILRRIQDLARVGVVFAGEPRLYNLLRDKEGRFGRIQSRIGFWPPVIKSITREDSDALARAGLQSLDDEVLTAFWEVCEGSARTLAKLIPNVRDFGLNQGHELTPKLVYSTAQQTMGIRASRAWRSRS